MGDLVMKGNKMIKMDYPRVGYMFGDLQADRVLCEFPRSSGQFQFSIQCWSQDRYCTGIGNNLMINVTNIVAICMYYMWSHNHMEEGVFFGSW